MRTTLGLLLARRVISFFRAAMLRKADTGTGIALYRFPRERVRAYRLWRCRRLWGRCAYRLAGARHGRLFPQPVLGPASRLSQPQFQYYGKRRQVWLRRPHERADHRRYVPFLTRHRAVTPVDGRANARAGRMKPGSVGASLTSSRPFSTVYSF